MYGQSGPRSWRVLFCLLAGALLVQTAVAHHGWGWATDEKFELTGVITQVRLGNPHGEVTLDVNGEEWVVEVGQPWRNDRAGLTEELLSVGREVTVQGNRSARPDERLMKAVRIVIDGRNHDLYPGRTS
ncbi:MAG: DUF6152 family protein [Aquisalimonadaceae bacterium]